MHTVAFARFCYYYLIVLYRILHQLKFGGLPVLVPVCCTSTWDYPIAWYSSIN